MDLIPFPLSSWLVGPPVAALLFLGLSFIRRRRRGTIPLPPGPQGLPCLGNVFQIPLVKPWAVYKEWSKQYGDVIYMEAIGQPIVVLNSLKSVQDILVKRAANYSDRPDSAISELMQIDWTLVLMRYGQRWRDHRRTFHQFFQQAHISVYHPIIEQENVLYLRRLLSNPKNFLDETRLLFGLILMGISYGVEDVEYSKELIHDVDVVGKGFTEYGTPGRLLVSVFPRLRYVPSWLPGAGWKRTLRDLGVLGLKVIEKPFNDTLSRTAEKERKEFPNIARSLIDALPGEDKPGHAYQLEIARNIAAISYGAGSDTTFSSAYALYMALAMHPEVQLKAQVEIDALTGCVRLPTCVDCGQLPYVQAIVKEVSRWHNVLPLSVPHASLEDDIYEGYFIPAGTVVLPNTWAIMHDPELFENPMEFNPERYLKDGKINPSVLDPEAGSFGYGRRICPGRYLSDAALTLMAASVLAVFDVKPPLDDKGNEIRLKLETDSRMIVSPLPFEVNIVPRSPRHVELLRSA